MMSGIGYASWNDTLIAKNNVRNGDVDVRFVQDNSYESVRGCKYVIPSAKIIDDKAHSMEVSLNNMYPGAWVMFKVKGVNKGTVPVKFDNVNVEFSGDRQLLLYLTFEAGLSIDSNGDKKPDKTCYFNGKLEDFAVKFNKEINNLKNVVMEPNGSGNFILGVPYDKAGDIEGKGKKDDYVIVRLNNNLPQSLQSKNLRFKLTINFSQF